MGKVFKYLIRAINGKEKFLIEEEALTRMVSLLLNLQEQSADVTRVTWPFMHGTEENK